MKRGILVLTLLSAFASIAYFTADDWAIRRETKTFYDASRDNAPVKVDVAVRRDKEMLAIASMTKLPIAIVNVGTAGANEYSFLANLFATRGYMALSIRQDFQASAPTNERGAANIKFALNEIKKTEPNADYSRLTLVGQSSGGDISMYFAKQYPDQVKKVVTLDNLRVPFATAGKIKILSFRSKDPAFKIDPGVVPSDDVIARAGITVVPTGFQHNELSGRDGLKASIEQKLNEFLADQSDTLDRVIVAANTPDLPVPGSRKTEASTITGTDPASDASAKTVTDDADCRSQSQRYGIIAKTKDPCFDLDGIVKNLAKGVYFYNKHRTAYVGDPLALRLVLKTAETQNVRQSLEALKGEVTSREGSWARSIEATVSGDDFKIVPAGPQQKIATTANQVEWNWTITPLFEGEKTLSIEVVADIQTGPERQKVQVTTFHEAIVIQVTTIQRLKSYLAETKELAIAAGAVMSSLLALVGFGPKIRRSFEAWRTSKSDHDGPSGKPTKTKRPA
jgi:hypothetical protein